MKYLLVAGSLAACSVAAMAQDDAAVTPETAPAATWEFFGEEGGRSGALVRGTDGTQLVFKCDVPGRREVHAIILSPQNKLAAPTTRPISRPIIFRFDGGPPRTENWGFFPDYAIAQGKSSDRALARLIGQLKDTSKVEMRLDTGISRDVEMTFDVAGAQEAIAKVFEGCKDSVPS